MYIHGVEGADRFGSIPAGATAGDRTDKPARRGGTWAGRGLEEGDGGMIRLKRAYDAAEATDGHRVLVERLWPRGVTKAKLRLDEWNKDVAPSPELRKWFGHDPERWPEFRRRYFTELRANRESWKSLLALSRRGRITFIYAAHDTAHNGALALKAFLEKQS
jgi:uncharacterized protein YeaO (DUF488 family)